MRGTSIAAVIFLAASVVRVAPAAPQVKPSTDELERRDQPVTVEDLRILERADRILASETRWNRRDTRECGRTDKTWSLFCALQKACIEVLGAYEHRRVALQEVRFAVEEMVDVAKLGGHRLMGFNNLETTKFAEIKRVLEIAKARVAGRLNAPGASTSPG
jgi:hypothetical protein